ncbi:MAG TPA: DNA mismatch repair protein MutL, partial [Ruminococcaceae bacterium]|nr:DNA mismatch repair protein MutL [Oscillospiraceae bacterium]
LRTYILCEVGEELIIIDKHAAHERIRFEKLKEEFITTSQLLIDKTELKLSAAEYEALHEYYEYVEQSGIELVFCDDCIVQITAMPSVISCSPTEIVTDVARRLMNAATEQKGALFDDMLHTMACKSAIKAHDKTDIVELQALAERVINDKTIRFCPHGRPVMTSLSKYKIEHFFNRS